VHGDTWNAIADVLQGTLSEEDNKLFLANFKEVCSFFAINSLESPKLIYLGIY
jgi:hypothetical protein